MGNAILPKGTDKTLAILPWNTCNARCAHCGPESAPEDKTSIQHEELLRLIGEAGELFGEGWCLTLSGGEIFLNRKRLLSYAQEAQRHGGYTTLITNGYWATSLERAKSILLPLKEAGLMLVGLSADAFHEPFISYDRIANAVRACHELKLRVHVRAVSTKTNRLSNVLKKFEPYNLWYLVFTCINNLNIVDSVLFLTKGVYNGKKSTNTLLLRE